MWIPNRTEGLTAPFGYIKDPQNKNHVVVDEVTATTVRLIYGLALEGYGTNRIGKVLYERKIPKPSYSYYQCTTYRKKGANFCTAHRISAGDIENAINADIDRHAVKAMKDKEKFINNVLLSMNESSAERSEKKFTMMSAHYEQEQDANEEKLSELEDSTKRSLLLLPMQSSLQRALHSVQA